MDFFDTIQFTFHVFFLEVFVCRTSFTLGNNDLYLYKITIAEIHLIGNQGSYFFVQLSPYFLILPFFSKRIRSRLVSWL